jgi:hypothetical protein
MKTKTMQRKPGLTVFVSYSHADKAYKDELAVFLTSLMRQEKISLWVDNCINPGEDLEVAINAALGSAEIVLLLISPDFIASDYCYERELTKALELHDQGKSIVVPVIIRPCDWHTLSFGRLKALPADGKPINTWANRDSGWHDVVRSIRELIESRLNSQADDADSTNSIRRHLKSSFKTLAEKYESAYGESRLSFGFNELDQLSGGPDRGAIVLVTGSHGNWHEALLTNIASTNALKQKSEIFARNMMCCVGSVSLPRVVAGELSEDDWPRISNAIALLASVSMSIEDTYSEGEEWSFSRISKLVVDNKIDLLLISGLDLLTVDGKIGPELMPQLRRIARENNLAVVCSIKGRGATCDGPAGVLRWGAKAEVWLSGGGALLSVIPIHDDLGGNGDLSVGTFKLVRDEFLQSIDVPFTFIHDNLQFRSRD